MLTGSTAEFKEIMEVNLMGTLYGAKAAGKYFKHQKETGTTWDGRKLENFHSGSFIVTSSMASKIILGPQATSPYCVSKAAVSHLVKGLAVEFVKFARVNAVCPGYCTTELLDGVPSELRDRWAQVTPMGREGSVHEMKGVFTYLASDASTYTTGSDILVDGGYTCV
ncbi:hypothetical protein TWF718_009189 [Orbilia javanica]|uniref:Uncharacterized protein n=1 Tax=Orbilia javanica TaxID=47235 RepID=A0AAN8MVN3_9PEZI